MCKHYNVERGSCLHAHSFLRLPKTTPPSSDFSETHAQASLPCSRRFIRRLHTVPGVFSIRICFYLYAVTSPQKHTKAQLHYTLKRKSIHHSIYELDNSKHIQITFHFPLSRRVYTKMLSSMLVGQAVKFSYLIKF